MPSSPSEASGTSKRKAPPSPSSPERLQVRQRGRSLKQTSRTTRSTAPPPTPLDALIERYLKEKTEVDARLIRPGSDIRHIIPESVDKIAESIEQQGFVADSWVVVWPFTDLDGTRVYKCIEGMHRTEAVKRLFSLGKLGSPMIPAKVLENVPPEVIIDIAVRSNEVTNCVVKKTYFQSLELLAAQRREYALKHGEELGKVSYASLAAWLKFPADEKKTTRRVAFKIVQAATPEAWQVLVADSDRRHPCANQDRLTGFITTRCTRKWGQVCYLEELFRRLLEGASQTKSRSKSGAAGKVRLLNKAAHYEECVTLAMTWQYEMDLVAMVWPEEGRRDGGLPEWPAALSRELWGMTSRLTPALRARLAQIAKKAGCTAKVPKVATRSDLDNGVFMVEVRNVVEKHWPADAKVSFAVALTNVREGRAWYRAATLQPAGPQASEAAIPGPSSRATPSTRRRQSPATPPSQTPPPSPVAAEILEASDTEVVSASQQRKWREDGRTSVLARRLIDDKTLDHYAVFRESLWQSFIKDIDAYSQKLVIVDGPWEVMDKFRFERDWDWSDGHYTELAHELNRIVDPNGTVIVYHGLHQVVKWIEAMSNSGFEKDTALVITVDPAYVNRRKMSITRAINAVHYALVFKRVGQQGTRNLSTKAFVLKKCTQPCRSNVIDGYVPPSRRVLGPDGKTIRKEEKSDEIYRELMYRYSNSGDTVFEPFAGSAAGAKAAVAINRIWRGCEKDHQCFEAARLSLAQCVARELLFGTLKSSGVPSRPWPSVEELQKLAKAINDLPPESNRPLEYPAGKTSAEYLALEEAANGVRVGPSGLGLAAGSGLFATRHICQSELIGVYWGTVGSNKVQDPFKNERGVNLTDLKTRSNDALDIVIIGDRGCAVSYCNHAVQADPRNNAELNDVMQCSAEEAAKVDELVKSIVNPSEDRVAEDASSFLRLPFLCTVVALKDIPPGTEILLDYGVDWRFLQEDEDEESSDS